VAERFRVIAVAVLALVLAGCATAPSTPGVFHGSRLSNRWPAPAVALTDTHGDAFALADAPKPLTLVFFGYTNCPDVCSQEMADITSALTRLDPRQRKEVDVVFVTTDPERDDEATIARYLAAFDDSFIGLTGPSDDVRAVTKALYIHAEKVAGADAGQGPADAEALAAGGKDYLVAHDDHTFAMDSDHRITALWNRDITSKQLAEDISHLLEE
jgi:protein SCO1